MKECIVTIGCIFDLSYKGMEMPILRLVLFFASEIEHFLIDANQSYIKWKIW